MKILVVGDLHGDWARLNQLISQKRPDIVLQCGDFGWWPRMEVLRPQRNLYENIREKRWLLKGLKPGRTIVYFCDGNHEDHPELVQDGGIYQLYENVFHCSRGSALRLVDGRKILFAGGAFSTDKNFRTPGFDWFPEEGITNKQLEMMLSYEKIDIVISHTCPELFDVKGVERKTIDVNRAALDIVLEKYNPNQWFFGHWHKYQVGKNLNTEWKCLDYPGHGGRWWCWLDK